jgi:hypothetical protein
MTSGSGELMRIVNSVPLMYEPRPVSELLAAYTVSASPLRSLSCTRTG